MAIAGSDGSIILTTKVDTSGIKKGNRDIKSSIDSTSKSVNALGNALQTAISKGNSKQAQLILSYRKATQAVEEQRQKVSQLSNQLEGLKTGEIKVEDKGVTKLKSDFEKLNTDISKTQNQISQLYAQLDQLQMDAFKDPTTQEPVFTPKEQEQFDSINAKLDELEPKLDKSKASAAELGAKLREAMGASTQAEISKVQEKLTQAENKLDDLGNKAGIAGSKLKTGMSAANNPLKNAIVSVDKFGNRILGLAKRVFVFSLVTRALRSLRTFLGDAIMSNEAFRNSLVPLQNQLWAAFAPIYNFVIPALQALINVLTTAMSYINRFIALITGQSYSSMVSSGQQLKSQVESYKNLGSSASGAAKGMKKAADASKEATKEAKKQLAAFDDLQILSEDKSADDAGDDTGGGAGVGDIGGGGAGAGAGDIGNLGGDEITATLLMIMGVVGVSLIAVGLILIFLGHPIGGVSLIIAGAMLAGYAIVNLIKENFTGEISLVLTQILTVAVGLMLCIGLILLVFASGNPLAFAIGLGLIVAGAGILVFEAIAAIKGALSEEARAFLFGLVVKTAIFMLAIGIILLFSGVFNAVSIGLVAAGAVILAKAIEEDKDAVKNMIEQFFKDNAALIIGVAVAVLVLGVVLLCCAGAAVAPLAIGMIVFGGALLAEEVYLNWDWIKEKTQNVINAILNWLKTWGLLVLGVLLCITGVGIPLGIVLIKKGAEALEESQNPTWEWLKEKVSTIIDGIFNWLKTWGLLVLGIILCLTGVGIPLGIALMKKGGKNLAEAQSPMWDTITNKVKEIWGDITKYWDENIAPIFTAAWWLDLGKKAINGLASGFESGINGIITMFENMINWVADELNKFKIDIPDWVPGAGGKSFGFNLSHVNLKRVSIPRLAQGAVIPANREFLAVLGDQKQGTNIEAPLETIVQAFNMALEQRGQSGQNVVVLELNGREFGRAVVEQGSREYRRVGTRLVTVK